MSIARTYYCDGPENTDLPGDADRPDGCSVHVIAALIEGQYLPGGFIEVRRHSQGASYEELHFCTWDCLLRYAAQQHATEYISGDPDVQP